MTLDELRAAVHAYAETERTSAPRRLRIEFDSPADLVDVSVGPPPRRDKPATRPGSREPEVPRSAADAVWMALFLAGVRRTGGELVDDVARHWPDATWSGPHVAATASREARDGARITHHTTPPEDGYGRGYGLVEWEGLRPRNSDATPNATEMQ